MRGLSGIAAIWALLALALGACGGSGSNDSPSGAASRAAALRSLQVDEDGDGAGGGYYDRDDGEIRSYGRQASPTEAAAITSLVQNYYAAAAAGDAGRACSLTYYLDAESLPEQYGQPPTPRWLLGARTCRAVLARVFGHFHRQLAASVAVVAVRVNGNRADAFVGFKAVAAGYVKAHREGRAWRVDGLLATPLP